MCNVPNCNEENCVHERVNGLKEKVMKKLDLAEKHRYKWKDQKSLDTNFILGTPAIKSFASSRGR